MRDECWIITDGKIGDEIPCRGLATAMSLQPDLRIARPRAFFAALAPWGLPDPRDFAKAFRPPYPAIAFAAGRRALPYLRRLKQVSPATFTIFLGHPRTRRHGADLLWAPAHDGLQGPDVISTTTTPHTRTPAALAAAREAPDERVAALPRPLAGLLLGGRTRHHRFAQNDTDALCAAAHAIRAQGFGLAITASRRTPRALVAALRHAFADDSGAFVWAGEGANPYLTLLALADALVVTTDSTNMVSEALAVGVPVHVYEPAGTHRRLAAFVEVLVGSGAVRRWHGTIAHWTAEPVDATPTVAAEMSRRWQAFQQARTR